MKIVKVSVNIKQGLPNYSSRGAEAEAVADEGESLQVAEVIQGLTQQITSAWSKDKPASVAKKETPQKKEKGILDDD